jgi:hypothetical protein
MAPPKPRTNLKAKAPAISEETSPISAEDDYINAEPSPQRSQIRESVQTRVSTRQNQKHLVQPDLVDEPAPSIS